jgi:hypothetical protein
VRKQKREDRMLEREVTGIAPALPSATAATPNKRSYKNQLIHMISDVNIF